MDFQQLPVDDVEVVEEPLIGESNLALRRDRLGDVVVRVEECSPVVANPREQRSSAGHTGPISMSQASRLVDRVDFAERFQSRIALPLVW